MTRIALAKTLPRIRSLGLELSPQRYGLVALALLVPWGLVRPVLGQGLARAWRLVALRLQVV